MIRPYYVADGVWGVPKVVCTGCRLYTKSLIIPDVLFTKRRGAQDAGQEPGRGCAWGVQSVPAQGAGSVCTQGAGAQDVGQESKSFQRSVQARSPAGGVPGICRFSKPFRGSPLARAPVHSGRGCAWSSKRSKSSVHRVQGVSHTSSGA